MRPAAIPGAGSSFGCLAALFAEVAAELHVSTDPYVRRELLRQMRLIVAEADTLTTKFEKETDGQIDKAESQE
jgi:hypothetical protein